jgi:hypothetical protein
MPSETTIEIVLTEESHAVVKCDLASAKTLLEVAENSCKAAVHDIKIAIKETDA